MAYPKSDTIKIANDEMMAVLVSGDGVLDIKWPGTIDLNKK